MTLTQIAGTICCVIVANTLTHLFLPAKGPWRTLAAWMAAQEAINFHVLKKVKDGD